MKKILLTLFGFITLGLINFGSCEKISNLIQVYSEGNFSINANSTSMLASISSADYGVYCLSVDSFDIGGNSWGWLKFGRFSNPNETLVAGNYLNLYSDQASIVVCFYVNQPYLGLTNDMSYSVSFDYVLYNFTDLLDTPIPVMSSNECKSTYSLVDSFLLTSCQSDLSIATGNLASCESDLSTCYYDYGECQSDLLDCQNSSNSGNCSDVESLLQSCNSDLGMCQSNLSSCMSGGLSGENWSALFVNSLQFPGKPIVNVLIPDYITWDYTSDDNSFNLSVGSGYDVDYINSVIDINSYRPTSEDFTDVFVSGLTLIMPYIGIVLLILFTRKLIKKIFK